MTTIQELAARTGVSVATVSRALNGSPEVSEVTRERILKLAHELDYTPSAAARTLVSRRSHVVGVILETGRGHPDLLHPFFQEVLVGLKHGVGAKWLRPAAVREREAGERIRGHAFVPAPRRPSRVDGACDGLRRQRPRDAEADRPRACPASRSTPTSADRTATSCRRTVRERARRAAPARARARADRHHHGPGTPPGADRLTGYRDELAASDCGARGVRGRGGFLRRERLPGTRRLLELDEPPTAIFAASDLMAAGACAPRTTWASRARRPGRRRFRRHRLAVADPAAADDRAAGHARARRGGRQRPCPHDREPRVAAGTRAGADTARRAGLLWSKWNAWGTGAQDQGGALAGLAAALTEPPAAGQSSHRRVNSRKEAEAQMSKHLKTRGAA